MHGQEDGADMASDEQPKKRWLLAEFVSFISINWIFFFVLVTIGAAVIGWVRYDISLLQPIEKIAYEQRQYRQEEEARELRERMAGRHLSLANSLLNVGAVNEAQAEFEEVLRLDPENAEAHFGVMKSRLFTSFDREDFELHIIEQRASLLLNERSDDPHVLWFLGQIFHYIEPDLARDYYVAAINIEPELAAGYYNLGVLDDLAGDPEGALANYRTASELSPWHSSYRNNLGYQLLRQGKYREASEQYIALLELDPDYLLSYYTLGIAARAIGDLRWSSRVQDILQTKLLDDALVMSGENSGAWFFHVGRTQPVYVDTVAKRRAYADMSQATTMAAMGRQDAAFQLMVRARSHGAENFDDIVALSVYDAQRLIDAQPQWSENVHEFLALTDASPPSSRATLVGNNAGEADGGTNEGAP